MFSLPTPTIDLPRERPNEPNKAVRFKRISAKQTERTQNVLSQTLAAPEHIRGVRLHSALRQKNARDTPCAASVCAAAAHGQVHIRVMRDATATLGVPRFLVPFDVSHENAHSF